MRVTQDLRSSTVSSVSLGYGWFPLEGSAFQLSYAAVSGTSSAYDGDSNGFISRLVPRRLSSPVRYYPGSPSFTVYQERWCQG